MKIQGVNITGVNPTGVNPTGANPTVVNNKRVSCKPSNHRLDVPPENQPTFKGIKGILKGGAIGAGVTAAGVTLVAGVAALPLFLGYVAVNGVIAATTGHLIESQNKDNK